MRGLFADRIGGSGFGEPDKPAHHSIVEVLCTEAGKSENRFYAVLTFDGIRPTSMLSIPGAMDHVLEVHSLSKAFNMTGWRLAFVAGRQDLIKAYATVKDNTDSGQFRAIQRAGAYALTHPELITENRDRYSRRFDLLIPALRRIGFDMDKPRGSFYAFAPVPSGTSDGTTFQSAEEFSTYLIRYRCISTVPWDEVGHFVRFSVTFEATSVVDEKTVISQAEERLSETGLIF